MNESVKFFEVRDRYSDDVHLPLFSFIIETICFNIEIFYNIISNFSSLIFENSNTINENKHSI